MLELPYRFDTSAVAKLILRGTLLLLLAVVAGIAAALLTQNYPAAVQLFLVGAIATYFGRLFFRNLEGSHGTISREAVVVEPAVLYGIRLQGQPGRFPLRDFKAVRVEQVSPPVWAQGGPHERVSLMGKEGRPDILIARASRDEGRALGRDLAAALGLPYEEADAP